MYVFKLIKNARLLGCSYKNFKRFSIVTNNIKYLGVTLTREVKDLYDKNYRKCSSFTQWSTTQLLKRMNL